MLGNALARTDDGQPSVRVDRRVVKAANVEQHGTVAEVAGAKLCPPETMLTRWPWALA
jgi:hypothetical protein